MSHRDLTSDFAVSATTDCVEIAHDSRTCVSRRFIMLLIVAIRAVATRREENRSAQFRRSFFGNPIKTLSLSRGRRYLEITRVEDSRYRSEEIAARDFGRRRLHIPRYLCKFSFAIFWGITRASRPGKPVYGRARAFVKFAIKRDDVVNYRNPSLYGAHIHRQVVVILFAPVAVHRGDDSRDNALKMITLIARSQSSKVSLTKSIYTVAV